MLPRQRRFGRRKFKQILVKYQEEVLMEGVTKIETYFDYNKNKSNDDWKGNVSGVVVSTPTLKTTQLFNCKDRDVIKCLEKHQNPAEEMNYQEMDIFHRAVCPILILGQCFALLPVLGVQNPNPQHLRFSLKSCAMMMTVLVLAATSFLTLAAVKHLLGIGVNAKNMVGVAFYVCVQGACVLFLLLAPKWPSLIRYWTKIELIFITKPYERPKRNLSKRIQLSAAVIIILFIVEHAFYLTSAVYSYTARTRLCAQLLNSTDSVSFDNFIRYNYNHVFTLLPYNVVIAILLLIINAISTFIWNFMDLSIMMIGMGVAYRFEQIKMRINNLVDTEVPESVFIEIREHYIKVCELLECIDNNLSNIILLSCMNNLYFICCQLLNIFNKLRWPINYIYFWYSLLYLIGRTAFVFVTAASIDEQSKGALSVLRRVSNKTWCIELERLIFEMSTQTVALSGKRFYFLTRRLLFGMAGTIVTYELVLLQFDEPNRSKGLPDLCS